MSNFDVNLYSIFKFLSLAVSGRKVLARLSEKDGLFTLPAIYTQDEKALHSRLEHITELINQGHTERRLMKNRAQILAAFNAIRTCKAQNGIPFDVTNPCV